DLVKTVRFPGPADNAWVRQCHALLAEGLGGDLPVPVVQMVNIPAPGQESQKVTVWYPPVPTEKKVVLKQTEQHQLKTLVKDPGMPLYRPREWAQLLA